MSKTLRHWCRSVSGPKCPYTIPAANAGGQEARRSSVGVGLKGIAPSRLWEFGAVTPEKFKKFCMCSVSLGAFATLKCNSAVKLRHLISDAYSAEHVLPNKLRFWGGGACLHCYPLKGS